MCAWSIGEVDISEPTSILGSDSVFLKMVDVILSNMIVSLSTVLCRVLRPLFFSSLLGSLSCPTNILRAA